MAWRGCMAAGRGFVYAFLEADERTAEWAWLSEAYQWSGWLVRVEQMEDLVRRSLSFGSIHDLCTCWAPRRDRSFWARLASFYQGQYRSCTFPSSVAWWLNWGQTGKSHIEPCQTLSDAISCWQSSRWLSSPDSAGLAWTSMAEAWWLSDYSPLPAHCSPLGHLTNFSLSSYQPRAWLSDASKNCSSSVLSYSELAKIMLYPLVLPSNYSLSEVLQISSAPPRTTPYRSLRSTSGWHWTHADCHPWILHHRWSTRPLIGRTSRGA